MLKGVIRVTPLDRSRTLSEETGIDLYLKMENFQRAGSFKMRGAYYKIHSLSDSERKRGWWPPPPATTPRAWRTPRPCSGSSPRS